MTDTPKTIPEALEAAARICEKCGKDRDGWLRCDQTICWGGEVFGLVADAALASRIAAPVLAEAMEALRAMSAAARAEFEAREAYKATPTDRGGASGTKGRAFFKWIDARAALKAAVLNAEGGK